MIHIRWMIVRDMPQVMEIENASFRLAWSEEDFLRTLRQRNCIGMVAEIDDEVVGFMIYELHKNGLNLLDFAVHPDARNKGVGSAMVQRLVSKLNPERRKKLTAAVCESNLHAHLFFARHGFLAKKIFQGFYGDESNEDAYWFEFDITKQPVSAGFAVGS
jgi:ribosomal-protein-alanine N-acetyltransferase